MNVITKIFKYLEPLWQGSDGKISLRAVIAIVLTYKLGENIDYAIQKWDSGRSLGDVSSIFFTLAGLIAALLGITAWSNMTAKKIDSETSLPPDTVVIVEKAETTTTGIATNGKTDKKQTDTTTTSTSTNPNTPEGDI